MNTAPEPRDPLIGTRIDGRYLVLGVLGRGGMGVVYDGVHEQLGRPVAIKVLGAGIADSEVAVERFLREARTASGLTHGNIVDVSDLGRLPDGRPFLVMSKMIGEDLSSLLYRLGPQTPARVVELLGGVAAALDLIHAKGFVHRDIKPENMMHVIREDGSEAVMVLDFGIVGLVSAKAARLTAEGSLFGTPAYLPPEVVEGDTMDRRGDVYALATCAFELMTGYLPFDAENPVRILPMKMMKTAPRMKAVSGMTFSEDVEAVIAKGLARVPAERHQTAGAFLGALDRAVRHVPEPGDGVKLPGAELARTPTQEVRKLPTQELEMQLLSDAPPALEEELSSNEPGPSQESSAKNASRQLDTMQAGSFDTARVQDTSSALDGALGQPRRRRALALFAAGSAALLLLLWLTTSKSPAPKPTAAAANAPPLVAVPAPAQPAAPAPATPAPASTLATSTTPRPKPTTRPHTPALATTPAVKPVPAPTPSAAVIKPAPQSSDVIAGTAPELNKAAMQALLQGHVALAAEMYTRATRVDPRNEAAFRGLGLANEKLGKAQDAARAFRRALELSPSGPQADSLRARLAKLEGH